MAPMQRLKGKVAVVTASTDGLGLAIARRLGEEGASLVISSRKQKNVDTALKQLRDEGLTVQGLVCHVAKEDHRAKLWQTATEAFGGVDILVSNAATNPYFGDVLNTPESAWDKIFDTNLKASFLLAKEAAPLIEKRGGGSIVFISSVGGYIGSPQLGAYSVSKTALFGLTKVLAPQCSTMNIRVNCVAPGTFRTTFAKALTDTPAIADEIKKSIIMERFGRPEEIGGTVAYLVSEDASFVTGETIVVSGGVNARL